jgi:hypothetical protein
MDDKIVKQKIRDVGCQKKPLNGFLAHHEGGNHVPFLFKRRWAMGRSCVFIFLFLSVLSAAHASGYTDEQIVRAIYKAEGGAKATYLYGIRSVKYGSAQEAYRICLNTVRNNRRRWQRDGAKGDYLTYLSKKYCPIGCENDRGTNRYWLKNVRFFLAKEVSHVS